MKKLLCLLSALALIACSKQQGAPQRFAEPAAPALASEAAPGGPGGPPAVPGPKRYIASRHKIELAAPGDQLQQRFLAIQAECLKLGCEILEASQVAEQPHSAPEASLTARIPPQAFATFLAGAQGHGKMISHHSESEDKTAQVIDVEAKIKNLEALRDRVAELLSKHTGNLKETLEAEKQLSETQAELDSINGLRRALAQQTDMVRVEIRLLAQSLETERSFMAPVSNAFKESGTVFMTSLSILISVIVAVLPWLLLLGGVFALARRLWRGRKAKGHGAGDLTPP